MAKKRRDKERDSSSVGKVAKVGAAALAVGVGAASFSKRGYTKKLTSEIAPAVIGTTRSIKTDLKKARASRTSLNKGLKMQDLYDTYQNHLKNNKTFKRQLEENKAKSIKLRSNEKRKSYAGAAKNFLQNKYNEIDTSLKKALKSELQEHYLKDKIIPKYKDKNAKHLKQLTDAAFSVIEEYSTIDKDGQTGYASFVDKHFERLNFSEKQKKEFLDGILEYKENTINSVVRDKEKIASAKKEIIDKLEDKLIKGKKRSDSLLGKVSNAINKTFDTNIDLETSLTGSRGLTVGEFLDKIKEDPNAFDASSFNVAVKNNSNSKNKYQTKNVVEMMQELVKKDSGVRDIVLDNSIRIDTNGKIFETFEFDDMLSNAYRKFSSTMPGSLFGQTDKRLSQELPLMNVFQAGKTSIGAAREIGNETTILKSSKVAITNIGSDLTDVYELTLDANFNLKFNSDAVVEGGVLRNIQHGKNSRLIKNMLGTNREAFNRNTNYLAQMLDYDQSGAPNVFEKLKARFTKSNNPD